MDTLASLTGVIELTTIVRVDQPMDSPAAFAAAVESALVAAAHADGIATLKQYFVRAVGQEIHIGLRFEGLPADNVDDVANELLESALSSALAPSLDAAAVRRTSTLLVGA